MEWAGWSGQDGVGRMEWAGWSGQDGVGRMRATKRCRIVRLRNLMP